MKKGLQPRGQVQHKPAFTLTVEGWTFWVKVEEEWFYDLSSQNNDADQLCNCCLSDLRLSFRIGKIRFSRDVAHLAFCLMFGMTRPCKILVLIETHHEKTGLCLCENKDADQLRSNCELQADQRLCFRYMDSTTPLLRKSGISSFQPASMTVQVGLYQTWSETRRPVFSRCGSLILKKPKLYSGMPTIFVRSCSGILSNQSVHRRSIK